MPSQKVQKGTIGITYVSTKRPIRRGLMKGVTNKSAVHASEIWSIVKGERLTNSTSAIPRRFSTASHRQRRAASGGR